MAVDKKTGSWYSSIPIKKVKRNSRPIGACTGESMNKTTLLVLALCLVAMVGTASIMPASAYNPDSWGLKLDNDKLMNVVGVYAHFVNCNGKYYAIMGGSSTRPGAIIYYDPITDKWAIANNSAIGPSEAEVVCNDKIYTFSWNSLKVYDTASQSLQQKSSPPVPIAGPEMYTLDNEIYVYGFSSTPPKPQVTWIYDPATDSWSQSPSLMPSYSYHSGTVIDNRLYVVGTNGQTTSLMIFDPQVGTWTQGAPVPNTVTGMSSCATSGVKAPKRLYVVGDYSTSAEQLLQVYDPQTKAWRNGTSPPSNVTVSSLTSVDDQIYAFCKSNFPVNGILNYEQIYVYTPEDYGVRMPTPTPSFPTNTPTSSPTFSPAPSPTEQPTPEPSPTPTADIYSDWIPYAIVGLVVVIVIAVAVYSVRHKRRIS